jgi:hypothetical protein
MFNAYLRMEGARGEAESGSTSEFTAAELMDAAATQSASAKLFLSCNSGAHYDGATVVLCDGSVRLTDSVFGSYDLM